MYTKFRIHTFLYKNITSFNLYLHFPSDSIIANEEFKQQTTLPNKKKHLFLGFYTFHITG